MSRIPAAEGTSPTGGSAGSGRTGIYQQEERWPHQVRTSVDLGARFWVALVVGRAHLPPLAAEGFEICETIYPVIVDGYGRMKVKGNWYSTPLYPGSRVTACVWPAHIEVRCDGEFAARHQRSYGHGHHLLNLEHYLDVLEKKPGAMKSSTPLQQWRDAGRGPACLDTAANSGQHPGA